VSVNTSNVKLTKLQTLLDKLVPIRLFSRLNIASKMLLGYMTLVGLTVIVVAYALVSLERINLLNRSIVKVDIITQESADRMLDAVLAQDTYEKRYLVLKSNDMERLFTKRGEEFHASMATLKTLAKRGGLPVDAIDALQDEYAELFNREIRLVKRGQIDKAYEISNGQVKKVVEKLSDALRGMSLAAKSSQDRKMKNISAIGGTAFLTTAMLCVFSILMGAAAGLIVTHHISSSINKLKVGTEHIAEGNFDFNPDINSTDEIGSLAKAFITMGKRLRKLEEMYLDASPLTRLPGGIAIENVLKKRIDAKQPLAFCVLDLDNFKAFNDRYGYANGSEVIKEAAHIIENAAKLKGTPEDFVGHVGGDDFVVITTPDHMREISQEVIDRFDQKIPDFYDPTDRERGHILGKTRQGVEMQFPIMTISIAIVTNEHRNFTNPLEASEIAAELKDYAKTIPKSVFVVDKRRNA
jgi:diguanylate cyclase (GGDEF)-like protein